MKKLIAMLLLLCMCFTLCACNSSDDDDEEAPAKSKQLTLNSPVSMEDYSDFTLQKIHTVNKLTASMPGYLYYENDSSDDTYVDIILSWTNTDTEAINCRELLKVTAVGDSGSKYEECMYAVESADFTSLNPYEDIQPNTTVRLHCDLTVSKSETNLTITLKADGQKYAVDYALGTTLSDARQIQIGDTLNVPNHATMQLTDIYYADRLLPPDTGSYYSSYSVEDPSNTYLIVSMTLSSDKTSGTSLRDFMGVHAIYLDKYRYNGFIVAESTDGTGFDYNYEEILPLTTRVCHYLIEVPKSVTENPAAITIFFGGQEYAFTL